MDIFKRGRPDAAPTPEEPRFGYSAGELDEIFGKIGGGSALQEHFTLGEEAPTGRMTDSSHDLLVRMLNRVEAAKRKEALLGRLGLK